MVKIYDSTKKLMFSFPKGYDEVTAEQLKELTSHVNLPKNKVLLCLIGRYKLFDVASSVKGKKEPDVAVVSLIAKADGNWMTDCGFKIGDSAVINSSELERGSHLYINSGASYDALCKLLIKDEEFRIAAMQSKVVDSEDNPVSYIYCLEFKIVNQYDIVGSISLDAKLTDPFEIKEIK